ARLFKGDFSDASAIKSAATGCAGVFINVSPTSSAHLELTHAQTIITVSPPYDVCPGMITRPLQETPVPPHYPPSPRHLKPIPENPILSRLPSPPACKNASTPPSSMQAVTRPSKRPTPP